MSKYLECRGVNLGPIVGFYRGLKMTLFKLKIFPNLMARMPFLFLIVCAFVAHAMIFHSNVFCSNWSVSVSLNAKEKKLDDVLAQLAAESGYNIVYNQEWGDYPISIQLESESLEGALNRILKTLDHAIVLDESNKKIVLYIYGSKASGDQSGTGRSSASTVSRRAPAAVTSGGTHRPKQGNMQSDVRRPAVGSRQEPVPAPGFSMSGGDTRFDQTSSTLAE